MPAIWAGIVVLGLNTAAYGAEVVRGALGAVPEGQREAGLALGFSRRQIMWRIIFPQAALRMIPPMGNLMIELLKNSSLVSLITLADLTFQGKEILRSEYPQETTLIFGALLAVYFVLAQALSQGSQWLERRLAVGRDYGGM